MHEARSRVTAVMLLATVLLAPVIRADNDRAIAALSRGDYGTAWREFMQSAQRGDAEAQAGVGAMLFEKLNPAGTGIYADCERWLLASARQNNAKGMSYLGRFYYADATRMMPGTRQAASLRFIQARQWFERAAALGDRDAMASLASMLDAGLGGPRDATRAARMRAGVVRHADGGSTTRVAGDPAILAMTTAWQAGHYAVALGRARVLAEKGDADGQALLGRAFYEGVGLPRDYVWALNWLNRAASQGSADGMFFLGLMHEHGRGVPQNLTKALELFDRAAGLGQRYAQMEARGMRVQAGSTVMAAEIHANASVEDNACFAAGGVASPGTCTKDGVAIDPYDSSK